MATIYKEVPHIVFESGSDQIFYDPVIREEEREILRGLARKLSEYAALPINSVRKEMWKRCNDLQGVKPMVWITELPWNELDGDSGLKLQTTSSFCRRIEAELRQTIYRWEHMQVDMVLEPFIFSPLVVKNSGIGVNFEEDILKTNAENDVVSHHFHIQIRNEEDIEKIVAPVVTHCEKQSQLNFEAYSDIFDGILAVRPRGVAGFWFAPWDDIVRFTGVQEVMMDLVTRPAYVHALVGRLVRVYLESLEQYERLCLLASNNCNVRVGSGAYGYSRELPSRESNVKQVRCSAIWGAATAQIFAGVSPEMHEEFALSYERQWLERFGLSYYGCCEPLDRKIGVLKRIPNLRKVSMSPWIDKERGAEAIGRDYVFSFKPSPTVLAKEYWSPEEARHELVTMLEIARRHKCTVEIIMKDISTVHNEPQRLWEWVQIAEEVTSRFE